MDVGHSVRTSLDRWSQQDWSPALLYATDAVEETARKRYPQQGVAARFKQTLRDDIDIFGGMVAPDMDFAASRFPIPVRTDVPDGRPDIADVLFGVHRFLHGHEEELPGGFEVSPHRSGVPLFHISRGHLQLRASVTLGLLAVAIFAPENRGEQIPGNYQLGWQQHVFHVSGWWGWQDHFRAIVESARVPRAALDFGPEWATWEPLPH